MVVYVFQTSFSGTKNMNQKSAFVFLLVISLTGISIMAGCEKNIGPVNPIKDIIPPSATPTATCTTSPTCTVTVTPYPTVYIEGDQDGSGNPVVKATGITYAQRYYLSPTMYSGSWYYTRLTSPGTVVFGVYSDGGQYPATLLFQSSPVSAEASVPSNGYYLAGINISTNLTQGYYWLAYEFTGSGSVTCEAPSSSTALVSYVPVVFPSTWPACASGGNPPPACAPPPSAAVGEINLYCEYYVP
jgi:hypothetical protein